MEESAVSGVGYRTSTLLAFLVFLALLLLVVAVDGQTPAGFKSIDCGQEKSYNDPKTGLRYVSDSDFIDTGENHKIPGNVTSLRDQQGYHLRSFPNGTRNCYRLPVVKDKKYLIRASFYYGNYDGLNQTPQFDLYLDVNRWKSIINIGATDYNFTEILAFASRNWMFVCLVNTGSGIPFISSLESRQLDDDMYPLVMSNQSSILFQRLNFQPLIENQIVRYPNDTYDRLWMPYSSDSLETLSTTSKIKTCTGCYEYPAPSDVLQTCGVPVANGSTINITLQWPQVDNKIKSRKISYALHYAEIQNLTTDQSRIFVAFSNLWNYQANGLYTISGYLMSGYIYNWGLYTISDDFFNYALRKAGNSTLPPIVSAIEVYEVKDLTESISTKEEEVEAMMEIKTSYKLKKNWQGDPCAPKDYVWEGVKCSSGNLSFSILSLNLSFSELSGEVRETFNHFKLLESLNLSNNNLSGKIPYLKDLQSLQILDLSNNNLSGQIPYFIADLNELKILNLSGNNLKGLIPEGLQRKSSDGVLQMDLERNPGLHNNLDDSERSSSSNTTVIIIAVVCSIIAALVVILFVVWKVRKSSNPKYSTFLEVSPIINSTNKEFSYGELVTMTRNFEKIIGKGGFGNVYHGIDHRNGSQVAVKMLSNSSAQGSKEFQMEANLLTRIHHKNLVSLVGYCIDKDHLALVYDYMEGGSLKNHIRGQDSNLKTIGWVNRMRIALEAAQGFDYLHRGCQPAIVHRDIKTDNILLSAAFDVKIADFGLSKIFENDSNATMTATAVMGTLGYIDPEYYDTQMLNEKSDVYSFGVVILELITGHPPIVIAQSGENIHLRKLVEPMLERGEIDKIVDQKLNGEYKTSSAWKALEVAFECIQPTSIQRPLMFDVVKQLKECLEFETSQGNTSSYFQSINIDHDSDSIMAPLAR